MISQPRRPSSRPPRLPPLSLPYLTRPTLFDSSAMAYSNSRQHGAAPTTPVMNYVGLPMTPPPSAGSQRTFTGTMPPMQATPGAPYMHTVPLPLAQTYHRM